MKRTLVCWHACVVAAAVATGCGFPPELDTPQLNANAGTNLQAYAASGTCRPGTYQGNVGHVGDKQFTLECTVQGGVTVSADPDQLARIRHIQVVQGTISVTGAVNLADAMPELKKCGAIGLTGGFTGTHFSAPASLEEAIGLTVEKTSQLLVISGFDKIPALQSLRIKGNTALTEIGGFGQVATLPYLEIDGNPKLHTVKPFAKLTQGFSVVVKNSPALVQFPQLPLLAALDKELVLNNLPTAQIDGFPQLKTVPVLKIEGCPAVTKLVFPELGAVGTLWLHTVPSLTSLAEMPKLQISGQASVCVEAMSCTALEAFFTQHTASKSPQAGMDCGAWVKCKP